MNPQYISWGITLWTAYIIVLIGRHQPSGTEQDPNMFSRKAAFVVACLVTFLIVTWPVTITIALVKERWRTPDADPP